MKNKQQDIYSSIPALRAAFHHKSALSRAQNILISENISKDIIPMWEEMGKYAINLYSARRVIDIIGCETAGTASLMHQRISREIVDSLIHYLKPSFIFGDGVVEKERQSPNVLRSLVYQVVGALSNIKGYLAAMSVYLTGDHLPKILEISVEKDPKTLVQELFQSFKWGTPTYKELERSGKEHNLKFKIGLSDRYGKSSVGNGCSKKEAEKDAAKKYLAEFHPQTRINRVRKIELNPDISKIRPNKMVNLGNSEEIKKIAFELDLPDWTTYILALSQTHRSYESCEAGPLGRDNGLLAFFGSYVVGWGIRDHILKTIDIDSINASGGLAETALNVFSKAGLSDSCKWLIDRGLQCIGKAMTGSGAGALQSMQDDMTQAFIAVLFLGREENVHHFTDVCHGVEGLSDYLACVNDRIVVEVVRSYKTALQEKCQAIGLYIRYATESSHSGESSSIRPKAIIESPYTDRTLSIYGETTISKKHEVLTHTHYEQKLAARICEIFDVTLGIKDVSKDLSVSTIPIQKLLLEHSFAAASKVVDDATSRKTQIFLNSEPLGLHYLKRGELGAFRQWIRNSAKSIDVFEHRRSLLFLYELSGQRIGYSDLNRELRQGLSEISMILKSVDPLDSPILTQNDARFQAIIDIASWLKISGGATQCVRLGDIFNDCKLLFKSKVLVPDTDSSIYEVRGAHLALIQLILDVHKKLNYGQCSLFLSVEVGCLNFRSEAPQSEIVKELCKRPLWNGLKGLMGSIEEIQSENCNFHIQLTRVNIDELDVLTMEAWWTHKCGGALNAAANDVIATILHDMKNELLGYFSASDQARASINKGDKYRLATIASSHLDAAISQSETIHLLLRESLLPKKSQVDLASFLRKLNSEVLTWAPINVKIVFLQDEQVNFIFTDEALLRSLLNNTIRNACEAFDRQAGSIKVSCRIAGSSGVQIIIEDDGPGFLDEQLINLNSGTPIASSKRHGPGIGLLTVLLLARELGGMAIFDRTESGGACISVFLPNAEDVDSGANAVHEIVNMEHQEVSV